MTTVLDANVHNVAVDGNFDDCQAIVKTLFKQQTDDEPLAAVHLGAVNSINWARIMAQIVYYFSGYYQWLEAKEDRHFGDEVTFVVPTGNFGNALAGYYARMLGLPIQKIVVATNSNDILHRFIANADYTKQPCVPTLAPAMDITIPSNFERYLYELAGKSGSTTAAWMESIQHNGTFDLGLDGDVEKRLQELRSIFGSSATTDAQIEAAVKDHQERHQGYTHCPHTACGIHAVENVLEKGMPYIVMATAHHGKFGITLAEADKLIPSLPTQLRGLEGKLSRCAKSPNDSEQVRQYLIQCVAKMS